MSFPEETSSCFGLFERKEEARNNEDEEHYDGLLAMARIAVGGARDLVL